MNNTYKLKKGEIRQIIKEEVSRTLLEIENPNSTDLREMIQQALANLEQHAELLKEITYAISSTGSGGSQKEALELIKAHGVYMGLLERVLETLR